MRFVRRCLYLAPLRRWKEKFPSLMVVRSEDLFSRTDETVAGVCRFLGIPPTPPLAERAFRKGKDRPDVAPHLLRELKDFFAPRNRELYDFIGRDMEWESGTEALMAGGKPENGA